DGDGAEGDDDAVRLDLRAPRRLTGDDERQGLVDRALPVEHVGDRLDEDLAGEVTDDPEPVEAGERVRARVEHLAVEAQAEEAVADARRPAARARGRLRLWELPAGHHGADRVRGLDVVELEPARRAGDAEVRLPGDDGDRLALVDHGDGVLADRVRPDPAGPGRPDRDLPLHRPAQQPPAARRGEPAGAVLVVDGG